MAAYQIEWKESAQKELRRLPKSVVGRIIAAVDLLAENPFPSGVVKLVGVLFLIVLVLTLLVYRMIFDKRSRLSAPAARIDDGICDVLSIATGSWDWRYAEEQGQNLPSTRYLAWPDRIAATIYDAALDCAEAAGRGDRSG